MNRMLQTPVILTSIAILLVLYSYSPLAAPLKKYTPYLFGFPFTFARWMITSFLLAIVGILFAIWSMRHDDEEDIR